MIYHLFFAISMCLLVGGSLYIGWRQKNAQNTSKDAFFLASRGVDLVPLALTLLATQVGGGMLGGMSQKALSLGPFAFTYTLGQALGLLVLGLGVGARLRQLDIATTAQIFDTYYKAPYLRKLASMISVVSLFGILVAMVIALKGFLYSMHLTHPLLLLVVVWSALIFYTMTGGLKSVIATDVWQMALIFSFLMVAFLNIALANPQLYREVYLYYKTDWVAPALSTYLPLILVPFLFIFVEQDMTQRVFAGKSAKKVSYACLLAGLCLLLTGIVPVWFGMIATYMGLPPTTTTSAFMYVVYEKSAPWVAGLVCTAYLAAIVSTADSLLIAITSNLCQDFMKISNKWAQATTLVVGLAALAGAGLTSDILTLLQQSYTLSVVCLFVPLVWLIGARSTKHPYAYLNKYVAYGSVFGGFLGQTIGWIACNSGYLGVDIPPALLNLWILVTLLLSFLGALLGKGWGAAVSSKTR